MPSNYLMGLKNHLIPEITLSPNDNTLSMLSVNFNKRGAIAIPRNAPIVIALVGSTAVGKTTVSAMLESMGFAIRVPRQTTRKARLGECPYHLQSVAVLAGSNPGDLIFGDTIERYVIPGDTIKKIKGAGFSAVVELGRTETAQRLLELHPPGKIVLVKRILSEEEFFKICRKRGMDDVSIQRRFADSPDINMTSVDYVVENLGSIEELRFETERMARFFKLVKKSGNIEDVLPGVSTCRCGVPPDSWDIQHIPVPN